ncbi:MAG: hypothetical protein O3B47_04415, partial [bacterium]|nr:hypothetical protein [bacterium]
LSKVSHSTRKVLSLYTVGFLDSLLNLLVAGILISYSLYAIEAKIPYLLYSVFFVFFGLFRYLYTIHRFNEGQTPEKVLFRDYWILITVLLWLAYLAWVFYYNADYVRALIVT